MKSGFARALFRGSRTWDILTGDISYLSVCHGHFGRAGKPRDARSHGSQSRGTRCTFGWGVLIDRCKSLLGRCKSTNGRCKSTNGRCKSTNGRCKSTNGRCKSTNGRCKSTNGRRKSTNSRFKSLHTRERPRSGPHPAVAGGRWTAARSRTSRSAIVSPARSGPHPACSPASICRPIRLYAVMTVEWFGRCIPRAISG